MTILLVSIEDAMTGFSEPRQAISVNAALRNFSDAIAETKLLSRHAADFALWQVGTFDPETGEVQGSKVLLTRAVDLIGGSDNGT